MVEINGKDKKDKDEKSKEEAGERITNATSLQVWLGKSNSQEIISSS